MAKRYNPAQHSVVQAFLKSDKCNRYEVPDYVEALIFGLYRELEYVYMNWHQELLEDRDDWQLNACGFEYRRYFWGDCDCGVEDGAPHLPMCSPQLPNMHFGRVSVNWYKHMGRGMSCNVNWNERQWRAWFDEAMKAIRSYNTCMQLGHEKFRDEDAGVEPFSTHTRVQCKDCKYCIKFGSNAHIVNRKGKRG